MGGVDSFPKCGGWVQGVDTKSLELSMNRVEQEYNIIDLIELKNIAHSKGAVVCGEMHGIKENYEAYLFLIEKLEIKTVAIEPDNTPFGFLLTTPNFDESVITQIPDWHDGRISEEFLSFLETLKNKS